MGRAIVREPAAFLMDEPLSNLDAKLRVSMRAELSRLHERLGVTTVYVTHDQVEAMTLGQRVAVMRDGRIQQVDVPQNLYKDPANLFVAAFIGSPSMNLVEATVADGAVEFAGFRFALAPERRPLREGKVILGIRPESFEDATFADPALPQLDVEVLGGRGARSRRARHLRDQRAACLRRGPRGGGRRAARGADRRRPVPSSTPGSTPGRLPRTGRALRLAVDPAQFHFFDPETGATLRRRAGPRAPSGGWV